MSRDAIQRRLTRGFIRVSPSRLILTPNTKEVQPSGGWKYIVGNPRAPILATLIPAQESAAAGVLGQRITVDGQTANATYILIAEYNATVEIGDTFVFGGSTHRIVHKLPTNGYEIRAVAISHG